MAQNIYDNPEFFAGYSTFPRSRDGLSGMAEWPAFRALLPKIAGKRVLDLGCGFGQLTRWAAHERAAKVLGIDLSEKMLETARARTDERNVTYVRDDLETLLLPEHAYDLVVSSMALHYVEDFDRIARTIHAALAPEGDFVFSVEHPIYAARAEPEWTIAADGRRAFVITDYAIEGKKVTNWVTSGIVKYHRSIATMLNALIATGFELRAIDEWRPSDADISARPEWADTELVRPMFLIMALKSRTGGRH